MSSVNGNSEHDLAQFHHRYPTGSLTAELLQIHDGLFIVRATIQVGGTTLATGLAAAPTIEQAEDQARQRTLMVLGIMVTTYDTQAHLIDSPPLLSAAPSPHLPLASSPTAASLPAWEPELDLESATLLTSVPPSSSEKWSKSRRPSAKSTPEPSPAPVAEPLDLSDVIAQTTVELKRLGWTEATGRNYLQRTYKKRSRQQLSDDELLEFLDYLRSQPGAGEPEF